VAHLHTQFNRDIPWATIDMDFMNLNQAAHGDREHGFIWSRLRLNRKVVVGFWQEKSVQQKLGAWCRAAAAWHDWQGAKFARFGDNMREVAVTEGDKVAAQIKFGYAVNGYGVGDLVKSVNSVSPKAIDGWSRNMPTPTRWPPICARAASGTIPFAKPPASSSACACS
jgi:L-arabinose isomerase